MSLVSTTLPRLRRDNLLRLRLRRSPLPRTRRPLALRLPGSQPVSQSAQSVPSTLLAVSMSVNSPATYVTHACTCLPLLPTDSQADTTEHGWPSFRLEEVRTNPNPNPNPNSSPDPDPNPNPNQVVAEHVLTNQSSGYVTSSCGTHLGTYLPDSQGARWCIDLSCVAGNPSSPTDPAAALVDVVEA